MSETLVRFGEADLTDCDREPIHIPGSVQPHGALLALDPDTLVVLMAGGATKQLLGRPPEALIGQSLRAELTGLELAKFSALTVRPVSLRQSKLLLDTGVEGVRLDVSASKNDGLLLLELEERFELPGMDRVEIVQGMVRQLESANSFKHLIQTIVDEVQTVTGFARVMLYRFQDDDSGHVIAEKIGAPKVESFLDLHYPAGDIPIQARALYLSSWIRHIPDARYRPAPLSPALNPKTGSPLDMSFCGLRSVSPIHLEYLANMGVVASTSMSLVIGGRLWGLVACHHPAPLHLPSHVRSACELFAQLASMQLQSRLEVDDALEQLNTGEIQTDIIGKACVTGLLGSLLGPAPNLLSLIPAAGIAVVAQGVLETEGCTPAPELMPPLLATLDDLVVDGVFATDRFEELTGLDLGGGIVGVLALAISRKPKDYILWFLPEKVREVRWAGDPTKSVVSGPLGDRLTPRKSFESWTETVRGQSRPWKRAEIAAAKSLRTALMEIILELTDALARERETARVKQNVLMAELDHRVKNTLATIESMVRFSGRNAVDVVTFVASVQQRLHSMAKTHTLLTNSSWIGASLRTLVDNELAPYNIPGGCVISVRAADFELEPKTAQATSMVLHELVTNAVKHGCLADASGRLGVTWELEDSAIGRALVIRWKEACGREIATPVRKGFGRLLMEKIFPYDVGGDLKLEFEGDGLRCQITIPESRLAKLLPAAKLLTKTEPSISMGSGLSGLRVLVVEDGALVAQDLAEWLSAAGAIVVGPCATLREATEAGRGEIDIALLDVDVNGEPVWSLARDFRARGVPCVFTTGFSSAIERPADFNDILMVNKPYDLTRLQLAITTSLGRSGARKS